MNLRKLDEFVIYRDELWYSTFPSVVRFDGGRLVCGFRRAPERRRQAGGIQSHIDPNSQAVCVASEDDGRTWDAEPRLVYAHPAAGCQDPCLSLLDGGTLLCTLFAWELCPVQMKSLVPEAQILQDANGWPMSNLGVHYLRSVDEGRSWGAVGLIDPPSGASERLPGVPSRGAVRGRSISLPDGSALMPVYGSARPSPSLAYRSTDGGATWKFLSVMAQDETVQMHEPHLHLCPSGKIVAFIRTAGLDGYLVMCHSTDGGESWSRWEQTEVWGHPFTTAVAADGRVLLAYGYRRAPHGVRCLLLDAECERIDMSQELVLRDDLANSDIGYPWAVTLGDGRILVTYYANIEDGTRHIAATVVEVGG